MAEKENGIDIRQARAAAGGLTCGHQRGFRNYRGIRSDVCVVHAGFIPDSLNDRQRVRNRFVLADAVTRVRPGEDYFLIRALSGCGSTPAAGLTKRKERRKKKDRNNRNTSSHHWPSSVFIRAIRGSCCLR